MRSMRCFKYLCLFVFCLILTAGLYAQPNPFGFYTNAPANSNITNCYTIVNHNMQQYGSKPQLIAIMPIDTMFVLPTSGSVAFEIRINAADADSLADVDSVWFYSRKSSYPNYPFYLIRSSSGFWFMMLQFTSQNRPDTYPFVFFAKDKAGNVSDSLVHYVTLVKNPSAVNNTGSTVPNGFRLMQNYPNPFNPVTTIVYSIGSQQHVTLKVFDLFGKEVSSLVDGQMAPGEHIVNFKAANLASGTYFYTLKAGSFAETKKLTLLK